MMQRLKLTVKLLLIASLLMCMYYLRKSQKEKKSESREDLRISTSPEPVSAIPARCPELIESEDAEKVWFETTFEQISPFSEYPNRVDGENASEVVIMTPISNVRDKMRHYFSLLCSLTYPHDKISVVLGEDSSHDQTLDEALRLAEILRPRFKRIDVFHLLGRQPPTNQKHEFDHQFARRKHLAMSRNQILSRGLRNEPWVLWLDSDVRHVPADLIQHLMSPGKDIVAANCLYRKDDGRVDTFDRNTWQETPNSLRRLRDKPVNFLMLEGYGQSERKFLNDLKSEPNNSKTSDGNATAFGSGSSVVELDGVGGCALLVRSDLHAKGLNFPPFVFDHHIETEGFARVAARVYGVKPHGLPRVHVIHW